MEHKGTIRLETDRLILRQFKIEDAENVFNNWASDDGISDMAYTFQCGNVKKLYGILHKWI